MQLYKCSAAASPPRARHVVKPIDAAPVEVEQQPESEPENQQAAPVMSTNANLQKGWARYQAAPFTQYNVVVIAPKKHRWPRRFFGAIGRGFGKVIGVR